MSDSTAQDGTGTAAAQAPAVAGTTIGLRVKIELDSKDGLRKVFFGLEEDMQGTASIWTIHFQLQERAVNTDDFTNVVTLDVLVDDAALHPAAKHAATTGGLTPPQAGHALGPASDDAKATKLPPDDDNFVPEADAKQTVRGTLAT